MNISGANDEDKEGGSYREYFQRADHYSITNFTTDFRGFMGRENELLLDLEAPSLDPALRNAFDVGLCHTTLEHVFNVDLAFQNLFGVCERFVIIVVPFAQMEHGPPYFGDYWRFTPMGVKAMIERHGWQLAYIAASQMTNAGIYLFVVAAATKELSESILALAGVDDDCREPETDPPLGWWIGWVSAPMYRRVLRHARRLMWSSDR